MTPTFSRSWKDRLVAFSDDHHGSFAAIVLLSSFFLSSFVLFLIWSSVTTMYGAPSISFREPVLNIFHSRTGTWLQVGAEVESDGNTWVHISRELVLRSNSERILLPSSEYYYPSGKQRVSAVYTLPMRVSQGEWCLEYAVRYKKAWAIAERSLSTTLGCTHVEPMVTEEDQS